MTNEAIVQANAGSRACKRVNAAGHMGLSALAVGSGAAVIGTTALHVLCLYFYPKWELDPWGLSDFYPLSVYQFRTPHIYQLGVAAVAWAAFYLFWSRLAVPGARWRYVLPAALVMALLSNLMHGWRYGIDYPTATWGTGGLEYYHDAVVLKGALWFLHKFNSIQFELLEHARTHPPGPVLLYYVLHRALGNPGLISISMAGLSISLGLPYLRRLTVLALGRECSRAPVLYSVLPAVLIYGIAAVDGLIASMFLAALVEFLDERGRYSAYRAAFFLTLSLFFTFGALFLPPVFVGFELIRRRRLARSALVIATCAVLLAALKLSLGFNWLSALRVAAAIENPGGFLLFANPRGYLWYRVGAVAEMMLFFTPFLCLLWSRGMRTLARDHADAYALSLLGPLIILLMLAAGAMKAGESARICMFVLPYLLIPVMLALESLEEASQTRVAHAVFAWGAVLQLLGFYHW